MSKKVKIGGCTLIAGLELNEFRRESRKLKSLDPVFIVIHPDKFWGMVIHRTGTTPEIEGLYITLIFGCEGTPKFWCYKDGSKNVDSYHLPSMLQVYKATDKCIKLYREKGQL